MDFLIKAAQLLLSLSILVVLHEFGHYLTARYFKIRVEKFYLFFNPWFSLFKKKIGETEWGIGWLPLGGFVKISGMIDESMDKEQMAKPPEPWEFRSKPAWQRLIVMIGGVVVNLIVGVLIYIIVLFTWGEEQIHTADLSDGLAISPYMEKYDLRSGDNILKIDGEEVIHVKDITSSLLLRDMHDLTVQRPDGTIEKVTLPDNIDYELFANGALPVAGLRHQSLEIQYLTTVNGNDSIGYHTSDLVWKINGTNVSMCDLSSEDFLKKGKYEVLVKRGKEDVTIPMSNGQFKTFLKDCPALKSGLKHKDRIVSINDQEINYFDEIVAGLYHAEEKNASIQVLRRGDTVELSVPISKTKSIGFLPYGKDWIDSAAIHTVHYSFGASLGRGTARGMQTLSDYVSQLKFLFTKKGASSIGGFGAIGNLFPPQWNWEAFWLNTALISIILAFMNILPIPALDGGHVVFLLYEMITGKEAPQKVLEYAQYIGFFLLIGLVLYANGNDIYGWLTGR
jgi:regulator of sigma E protease